MLCVSVHWTYIIVLQIHARLQCHLSILYDPHPQSGCKSFLFVDPVLELSAKSYIFSNIKVLYPYPKEQLSQEFHGRCTPGHP